MVMACLKIGKLGSEPRELTGERTDCTKKFKEGEKTANVGSVFDLAGGGEVYYSLRVPSTDERAFVVFASSDFRCAEVLPLVES